VNTSGYTTEDFPKTSEGAGVETVRGPYTLSYPAYDISQIPNPATSHIRYFSYIILTDATEQFSSMDPKKDEEKKAAEKVSQAASDSVKVPEPAVTQNTAPTQVKR
jgi:hypothetical protein